MFQNTDSNLEKYAIAPSVSLKDKGATEHALTTDNSTEARDDKTFGSTQAKLSEKNHAKLFQILTNHSTQWKEIGTHLGFLPSELDDIQARPLLLCNAPKSWLSKMLEEWLQWTLGDRRGSTSIATVEALRDALNQAGCAVTAQSINANEFKNLL